MTSTNINGYYVARKQESGKTKIPQQQRAQGF